MFSMTWPHSFSLTASNQGNQGTDHDLAGWGNQGTDHDLAVVIRGQTTIGNQGTDHDLAGLVVAGPLTCRHW